MLPGFLLLDYTLIMSNLIRQEESIICAAYINPQSCVFFLLSMMVWVKAPANQTRPPLSWRNSWSAIFEKFTGERVRQAL